MMATIAARSLLRSATRTATARLPSAVKPKASPSHSLFPQKPLTARILRLPVELSSVGAVSMLPYHTATAAATLNSMLSLAPCGHGWSIEGL